MRPGFHPRVSEAIVLTWRFNSASEQLPPLLGVAAANPGQSAGIQVNGTVCLSPKGTKDFSDIISYLLITGEKER